VSTDDTNRVGVHSQTPTPCRHTSSTEKFRVIGGVCGHRRAYCKESMQGDALRQCRRSCVADEGAMSLLLILIILLLVLGGGGFYAGGPRVGISLGGLILLIIIFMAVTGRL
jgi:hypothetical protein